MPIGHNVFDTLTGLVGTVIVPINGPCPDNHVTVSFGARALNGASITVIKTVPKSVLIDIDD